MMISFIWLNTDQNIIISYLILNGLKIMISLKIIKKLYLKLQVVTHSKVSLDKVFNKVKILIKALMFLKLIKWSNRNQIQEMSIKYMTKYSIIDNISSNNLIQWIIVIINE
jgi:hypothetical protein